MSTFMSGDMIRMMICPRSLNQKQHGSVRLGSLDLTWSMKFLGDEIILTSSSITPSKKCDILEDFLIYSGFNQYLKKIECKISDQDQDLLTISFPIVNSFKGEKGVFAHQIDSNFMHVNYHFSNFFCNLQFILTYSSTNLYKLFPMCWDEFLFTMNYLGASYLSPTMYTLVGFVQNEFRHGNGRDKISQLHFSRPVHDGPWCIFGDTTPRWRSLSSCSNPVVVGIHKNDLDLLDSIKFQHITSNYDKYVNLLLIGEKESFTFDKWWIKTRNENSVDRFDDDIYILPFLPTFTCETHQNLVALSGPLKTTDYENFNIVNVHGPIKVKFEGNVNIVEVELPADVLLFKYWIVAMKNGQPLKYDDPLIVKHIKMCVHSHPVFSGTGFEFANVASAWQDAFAFSNKVNQVYQIVFEDTPRCLPYSCEDQSIVKKHLNTSINMFRVDNARLTIEWNTDVMSTLDNYELLIYSEHLIETKK